RLGWWPAWAGSWARNATGDKAIRPDVIKRRGWGEGGRGTASAHRYGYEDSVKTECKPGLRAQIGNGNGNGLGQSEVAPGLWEGFGSGFGSLPGLRDRVRSGARARARSRFRFRFRSGPFCSAPPAYPHAPQQPGRGLIIRKRGPIVGQSPVVD